YTRTAKAFQPENDNTREPCCQSFFYFFFSTLSIAKQRRFVLHCVYQAKDRRGDGSGEDAVV
ncbi:MAG: hypothetical protein IJQ02_01520, partial [Oscillospiraceae bacterium]|nr:hypothetical protein [Oscillospiraceae bacterium]